MRYFHLFINTPYVFLHFYIIIAIMFIREVP